MKSLLFETQSGGGQPRLSLAAEESRAKPRLSGSFTVLAKGMAR